MLLDAVRSRFDSHLTITWKSIVAMATSLEEPMHESELLLHRIRPRHLIAEAFAFIQPRQ